MLRILGSPKKLCDGWTRRDLLTAAGLGALGLRRLVPAAARRRPRRAARRAASARPRPASSSTSTARPASSKPSTRSRTPPSKSAASSAPSAPACPALDVGELLPHTSPRSWTASPCVRSMTHPYPIHGVAYALTGVPQIDVPMELNPRDGRHWPFIGSVVDYLGRRGGAAAGRAGQHRPAVPVQQPPRRRGRRGPAPTPPSSAAPTTPSGPSSTARPRAASSRRCSSRSSTSASRTWASSADGRFEIADAADAAGRPDARPPRRSPLAAGAVRPGPPRPRRQRRRPRPRPLPRHGLRPHRTPTGCAPPSTCGREPAAVRESYGMTLFGQAALAARRLVEAGSRFVSVFWDEYGLAGSAWDTHWEHYPRMKNELCPGFDRAFAGLHRRPGRPRACSTRRWCCC